MLGLLSVSNTHMSILCLYDSVSIGFSSGSEADLVQHDHHHHRVCSKTQYEKCGIAYAKSLGIDPMPQDPMKFDEHLVEMFAKYGARGFMTVCKYRHLLLS